jgi:hypothetical protein
MSYTEGSHTAVARQWNWGLTEKGNQQVAVEFEILDGPDAGKRITWFGYFSEKARKRTLESLRYCGWKNDDIMDMLGMGDLQVVIVIGYEEYENRTRAKVQWINQPSRGVTMERPMDMASKRMFAAELKLHARQVPVVTGPAAPDRAKTEPTHEAETDEPF